jgi:hypothetical protein
MRDRLFVTQRHVAAFVNTANFAQARRVPKDTRVILIDDVHVPSDGAIHSGLDWPRHVAGEVATLARERGLPVVVAVQIPRQTSNRDDLGPWTPLAEVASAVVLLNHG